MAHAKILNRDRQLIPEFFRQVSLKEVGGLHFTPDLGADGISHFQISIFQ
jgi:hypothetical protein